MVIFYFYNTYKIDAKSVNIKEKTIIILISFDVNK